MAESIWRAGDLPGPLSVSTSPAGRLPSPAFRRVCAYVLTLRREVNMVVVTGASGHVGSVLVRDLLSRGTSVRALVQPGTPTPGLDGLDIERVSGDVRDPAALRAAFAGADVVYHLAAIISVDGDPHGTVWQVNVEGARNAATAALGRGVRRYVHVSSVHAFDHAPYDRPLDEARGRPGPRHPVYDRSKAAGEVAVRQVFAAGLDGVIVNPTGIFGPYDYAPSHAGMGLLRYARGRIPVSPNGGFDWVDVRDVSAALIAAAERGRSGEGYLVSGAYRSAQQIAELVERFYGAPSPRAVAPLGLLGLLVPPLRVAARVTRRPPLFTHDMLHALRSNRQISSEKAARELGHRARPIDQTIHDSLAWFAARGLLPKAPTPWSPG